MCASSSPLHSTISGVGRPFTSHEQEEYTFRDSQTSNSPYHTLPPSSSYYFPQTDQLQHPIAPTIDDPMIVKKLNHNAAERGRRKSMNGLYSSLRSLLPATDDQKKKLSIPATVTQMVKYIPELQKQVERLSQKKEELLSRISRHEENSNPQRQVKMTFRDKATIPSTSSTVSVSRLGDRQVFIQISTLKAQQIPLSDVLLSLEEDGLQLTNAASLDAPGGRLFHSLHLQVEESDEIVEFELLRQKLLSLYARRDEMAA